LKPILSTAKPAAVCLLTLLGCGRGLVPADAGICPAHAPCGGNVVGTWRFSDQCLGGAGSAPPAGFSSPVNCSLVWPSLTYASSFPWTITFSADGTFDEFYAGVSAEVMHYPASCLATDGGAGSTCSAIEGGFQDAIQSASDAGTGTTPFMAATCELDSSGNCECNLARTDTSYHGSGIYTTVGEQLTMEETSDSRDAGGAIGSPDTWDYCVSGNTLTLSLGTVVAMVATR
jgi:hypothetical protein